MSAESVFERDPCDGCEGTCGDVCPVWEARQLNVDREIERRADAALADAKAEANSALTLLAAAETERDRLQAENEALRAERDDQRRRSEPDGAGGFRWEAADLGVERDRLRERLRVMAREVNERLNWVVRDRTEPDKVLANVSTTRSVLVRELALAPDPVPVPSSQARSAPNQSNAEEGPDAA